MSGLAALLLSDRFFFGGKWDNLKDYKKEVGEKVWNEMTTKGLVVLACMFLLVAVIMFFVTGGMHAHDDEKQADTATGSAVTASAVDVSPSPDVTDEPESVFTNPEDAAADLEENSDLSDKEVKALYKKAKDVQEWIGECEDAYCKKAGIDEFKFTYDKIDEVTSFMEKWFKKHENKNVNEMTKNKNGFVVDTDGGRIIIDLTWNVVDEDGNMMFK